MKDLAEFLRALPRPVLAIVFPISWIVFVFGVYESGGTIDDVPLVYTGLVVSVMGSYFALRSWEKAKQNGKKEAKD